MCIDIYDVVGQCDNASCKGKLYNSDIIYCEECYVAIENELERSHQELEEANAIIKNYEITIGDLENEIARLEHKYEGGE